MPVSTHIGGFHLAAIAAAGLHGCGSGGGGDYGGPPPTDTTPPTVPGNVQAVATGPTSIRITWSASSDTGSGVAGYEVFRDAGANPIWLSAALSAFSLLVSIVCSCDNRTWWKAILAELESAELFHNPGVPS